MSTIQLQKDPCSEFPYSSIHDSCGLIGALPAPAGYKPSSDRAGGFDNRDNGSRIGSVSIVKPKEYGGITATT
jgi:quinoprotein glucose dehydrogenase